MQKKFWTNFIKGVIIAALMLGVIAFMDIDITNAQRAIIAGFIILFSVIVDVSVGVIKIEGKTEK